MNIAVNQTAVFEETLQIAIATRLPPPVSEYEDRLVTFKSSSWPADCPTPDVMAKAGFYSTKHKSNTLA